MKDVLFEFWSDIKNLENASLEDVQRDILAYLEQRQSYKNQAEKMQKALQGLVNLMDLTGQLKLNTEYSAAVKALKGNQ